MKDEITILWNFYVENWNQARHHEVQRSTMTGLVVVVAGAIVTLVTADKNINRYDLPLDALMIALGIFGALFSAKQYERSQKHIERARGYRARLDELLPEAQILTIHAERDARAEKMFPRLSRWRLNSAWVGLHVAVIFLGVALAIVSFLGRSAPEPSSAHTLRYSTLNDHLI